MNYAIPGFQTPAHPKFDGRAESMYDGSVDFMFMDCVPLEDVMPNFNVVISLDRDRRMTKLAALPTTRFIYYKKSDTGNTKEYWFRLLPDELTMLPGTYTFRFLVGRKQVAEKSVTIHPFPGWEELNLAPLRRDLFANSFISIVFTGSAEPEGFQVGRPGDEYIQIVDGQYIQSWVKATGIDTNTGWT